MDLIYFVLAAYGLTQILVVGSIFNKIRPSRTWLGGLGKLFHCPMCMGFWAPLIAWLLSSWQQNYVTGIFKFIGFAVLAYLGYIIFKLDNEARKKN